jgi:photosystem II stability/assembly factor-like uncharacterized protein
MWMRALSMAMLSLAAATAVWTSGVSRARAHGATPTALSISFDPGEAGFRFVTTNVFGHYVSADGGSRWSYLCPEVSAEPGNTMIAPSGAAVGRDDAGRVLVVASQIGLRISEDDGCSWSYAEGARTESRIAALYRHPGDPARLYATTAQGGADNALLVSTDAGRTWSEAGLGGNYFLSQIRIHGASGRLYVVGYDLDENVYRLFERPDEGTWSDRELPDRNGAGWELMAVDRDDASSIYLSAHGATTSALVRLEDAGPRELFTRPGAVEIEALLQLADGSWRAGLAPGGVLRSDDGETWSEQVSEPPIYCLRERPDGALLGCAAQVPTGASVLVSEDGGASWSPWLSYEQVCAPLACSLDGASSICSTARWRTQVAEYREWGARETMCEWPEPAAELDMGGADAGGATALDLGTGDDAGGEMAPSTEGSCSATRTRRGGATPLWAAAVMLAALAARRRRRRP